MPLKTPEQRREYHREWARRNKHKRKAYYEANKERIREQHRAYYAANREKIRAYDRERTKARARWLKGECAICHKHGKLVRDHCHATGKWRELLCNKYNLLLGHAEDNVEILRNAIEYLDRHR